MTSITDEMLSAFLDGELGASQADEVRAALDSDPILQTRLRKFEQADATMRNAATHVAGRQLPPSVMAIFSDNNPSVAQISRPRRESKAGSHFWPVAWAASIALVVGLSTGALYRGFYLDNRDASSMQIAARVTPGDPLFDALEATPSGELLAYGDAGESVRPVLSFASANAEPCREFVAIGSEDSVRAVACREQNAWRVDIAIRSEIPDFDDGYRPASASDARLVSEYISAVMVGDAFGGDVESQRISNGWRSN